MYRNSNIYLDLRIKYLTKFIVRHVSPVVLVGLVCWAAYMYILLIQVPSFVSPVVITLN